MKIIDKIGQLFGSKVKAKTTTNAYNEAFFEYIGETGTGYDTDAKSYIDHGYNVNSIVYSIVNQQARKSAKVPFYIKKVDDEQKAKQFLVEIKKENIGQPQVKLNAKALEKKAFSEVETMEMPIEKPNIFQSWPEFISLYKTFLKLTGNVYIYMMAPENGVNAGAPMAFYLLPSHLIDIVLKPGANLMIDDSPVDFYRLTEGAVYKDFNAENVVHIKYSNPNFDMNGSHLYGQSPLKSALKNIESANEALTQNIKTLKNSGAFGFIHGKQQPLNPDQAKELKDRLREMDASPERLSNIAGVSAEVGFTRLTLTTDELQPFAYLSYDEKQLCNVLGWSDKLLNNDAGAKYSNIQESRKQVVTDDIMPDLGLLETAFNDVILPKYTKYANTMLYFDVSTLPEMQLDMASLTSWLTRALKDGVINRNEYREALNYPILEEEEMHVYTVSGKLNPLERALEEDEKPPMPGVPGLPAPKGKPNPKSEKKNRITNKGGFKPTQTRDENGRWSKEPGAETQDEVDYSYRGSHYISEEYSSPLDNLLESDSAPRDFYDNIHHYDYGRGQAGKESMRAILSARGNPNKMVWIYRGVPPGVKEINHGDWVSLSKTYAEEHAYGRESWKTGEPWIVVRRKVAVKDVRWDANDINEMAYFEARKKKSFNLKAGFNPNQARGADGKWGVSGVPSEFLGYHSTNSDLDGLTPGEVLSPEDYEDVLWRTYTEYFYDTGELVENRDIDGIAEWFEENGYSFTYVSSEPIMGSAYQASKYKYGENLFKVFGDGKELLMDDYNELNATIILSKNPLFFERVDEEKTGIVERMIKALDLDGEPGDITIKAGFDPNQQRNADGTWGDGGPGETEFKEAKTIEDAEQWAKDNGIEADYSKVTLEQANAINEAIFNVNSKLLDEIKLPINKIIFVDDLDVGATVNLDGDLEINPDIWKNEHFIKLNSRLEDTRNRIIKDLNKLEQQLIDDPFGDWSNIDEVKRRIDFNKQWLSELADKEEFSKVTTNVVKATEHELGHYVDRFLSSNTDYTDEFVTDWDRYYAGDRSQLMYRLDKISKNEGYKLGQYAKTRGNEYFAEAWVAYVNNEHDKINLDLLNVFKKITK